MASEQASSRMRYLIFGSLGVISVVAIAFGTLAVLKAYAPVKMVASTQDLSEQQRVSSSSSATPAAAPIVPTTATSAAVDTLQALLQTDESNDSAVNSALDDSKRQISVPTE